MSIGATIDVNMDQGCRGVSFMTKGGELELLQKVCLGNAEARLQLVKSYLNLVVEIAAAYAAKTGKPFSQFVKVGAMAITRAANDFQCSQRIGFDEYVKLHIIKAMEENSYT